MNYLEVSNPESVDTIIIEYPQDEWDNEFGDHSISSF